jgi:hypothetical protein
MSNSKAPKSPGIYVARILTDIPMPVTRDKRYVETCARVDNRNVKVGKAQNLAARQSNYWKDFDEENVVFIPLAILDDIQRAETAILRHLKKYRKRSPKGRLMDWLENIGTEAVIKEVYSVLTNEGIRHDAIWQNPHSVSTVK